VPRHDIDHLNPGPQPIDPVAVQAVDLARPQADFHSELDERAPLVPAKLIFPHCSSRSG
jgi:hypothetical protein